MWKRPRISPNSTKIVISKSFLRRKFDIFNSYARRHAGDQLFFRAGDVNALGDAIGSALELKKFIFALGAIMSAIYLNYYGFTSVLPPQLLAFVDATVFFNHALIFSIFVASSLFIGRVVCHLLLPSLSTLFLEADAGDLRRQVRNDRLTKFVFFVSLRRNRHYVLGTVNIAVVYFFLCLKYIGFSGIGTHIVIAFVWGVAGIILLFGGKLKGSVGDFSPVQMRILLRKLKGQMIRSARARSIEGAIGGIVAPMARWTILLILAIAWSFGLSRAEYILSRGSVLLEFSIGDGNSSSREATLFAATADGMIFEHSRTGPLARPSIEQIESHHSVLTVAVPSREFSFVPFDKLRTIAALE